MRRVVSLLNCVRQPTGGKHGQSGSGQPAGCIFLHELHARKGIVRKKGRSLARKGEEMR